MINFSMLSQLIQAIFSAIYKAKNHTGKILWIPLLASAAMLAGNILMALSNDGMIDDTEFHALTQGASGIEVVALIVVMALLKLRKPPDKQ